VGHHRAHGKFYTRRHSSDTFFLRATCPPQTKGVQTAKDLEWGRLKRPCWELSAIGRRRAFPVSKWKDRPVSTKYLQVPSTPHRDDGHYLRGGSRGKTFDQIVVARLGGIACRFFDGAQKGPAGPESESFGKTATIQRPNFSREALFGGARKYFQKGSGGTHRGVGPEPEKGFWRRITGVWKGGGRPAGLRGLTFTRKSARDRGAQKKKT